jgi:hypothetical protein
MKAKRKKIMNYACALVFTKYGSRKSINGGNGTGIHGVYIPLKGGGVMLELIIDFAKHRHSSVLQPSCLLAHLSLYLP